MTRSLLFGAALLAALVAGCSDEPPTTPPGEALFRLRHDLSGEVFHVLLHDSATIVEAERLLASGEGRFASGRPVAGDGGFNAPWSWHIAPDTVVFAQGTVEACQTTPTYLEQNLDYWLAFGQVCIGSYVEARER